MQHEVRVSQAYDTAVRHLCSVAGWGMIIGMYGGRGGHGLAAQCWGEVKRRLSMSCAVWEGAGGHGLV